MMFSFYICAVINITNDKRTAVVNYTLPDFGFDLTAAITPDWILNTGELPDIISSVVTTLAFARILFDCGLHRCRIFRRVFFLMGTLMLLRGLCIMSTSLPNPFEKCKHRKWGNTWVDALWVMIQFKATCTDVFYSGHSVVLTIDFMIINEYVKSLCQRLLFLAMVAFGYYCIIATRFHYTIDVEIALALTIVIWKYYHNYVRTRALLKKNVVFRWFEDSQKGTRRGGSMLPSSRSGSDVGTPLTILCDSPGVARSPTGIKALEAIHNRLYEWFEGDKEGDLLAVSPLKPDNDYGSLSNEMLPKKGVSQDHLGYSYVPDRDSPRHYQDHGDRRNSLP